MEDKLTQKEKEIAEFLQSRGYEGIVPLYTALLIESLPDSSAPDTPVAGGEK